MSGAFLNVTVSADAAPILKLGETTLTASTSADKMTASFVTAGGACAKLDRIVELLSAHSKVAATGIEKMGSATAAARVEMGALSGSTGMMLGGLSRMAGQSAALAPLVNQAFAGFAVVAFVDIVDSAIERIDKAKDAVAGMEREWLVASSATREHSAALEIETLKLSDEISMIEGRPKKNMLAIALREASAEAEKLYGTLSADVGKQLELLEKKGVGAFDAMLTNTASTGDLTEKLKPNLTELQTALERQKAVYLQTDAAIANSSDEEAKRRAKAARDAADTEVETSRASALALVASLQQSVTARKEKDIELIQGYKATGNAASEFGKNTAFATETTNRTFASQESILAGLRTSLIEMGKAQQEIKGIAPLKAQLAGDEGQRDAAERARESAQVKIDAEKKYALAWMDSVEAMAKAELQTGEMTATEEINQRREMEDEKFQIQTEALNKQIALIAKNPSADKTKDANKTATLNAEKEEVHAAHLGKMASLDAEYARAQEASVDAASEAGLKFLDEQQKAAEEKMQAKLRVDEKAVASAQTIATEQLAISRNADDEALRTHKISLNAWAQESIAAVDHWAAAQKPAIEKAMKDVQAAIKAETDPKALDLLKERYQALIEKMAQLDQKRLADVQKINLQVEQRWMEMIDKQTAKINSSVTQWITGQETFRQASKQVWTAIADDAITAILKIGEKWIEEHVIMAAVSKVFGIDDGTAAASAKRVATAKIDIEADAGQASADVFLQAIEAIPFPANLAVAPALAAATHAQVTALGAFEAGGIARETGIYNLHAGEGVMTRHQTEAINRAGAVTNNAGARHFHTTVNIHHNGTNLSEDDIARSVTRAIRRGTLRVP